MAKNLTVDLGHVFRDIQTMESRFLARSMRTVGEFAASQCSNTAEHCRALLAHVVTTGHRKVEPAFDHHATALPSLI